MDLVYEIQKLKKEKNAVILAHYYQAPEIQDIADYIGDSLALAKISTQLKEDMVVFAGVHFMAETTKILVPEKKVLIPDLNAGCSLAESCKAIDFEKFKKEHPNHLVISYVNTTAEIKALTDIVCTSSNAVQIVKNIPSDQPIIFGPDRNLGNYVKSLLGRENMLIWDGACHVHEEFSLEKILEIKKEYPKAKIIAHPECKKPILLVADKIGSTAELLSFVSKNETDTFIVVTESGILHQMKKREPNKIFIPAPPIDSTCGCNDCKYMKLITLQKIYDSLKEEKFVVEVESGLAKQAKKSIDAMLRISKELGI